MFSIFSNLFLKNHAGYGLFNFRLSNLNFKGQLHIQEHDRLTHYNKMEATLKKMHLAVSIAEP